MTGNEFRSVSLYITCSRGMMEGEREKDGKSSPLLSFVQIFFYLFLPVASVAPTKRKKIKGLTLILRQ